MPRSSSGVYSQPPDTLAVSGEIASASSFNTLIADLGDELTESLTRSGSAVWSDDQDAGGNKLTDLATPTASTDAVTKGYVDDMGWSDKLGAIEDLTWAANSIIVLTGTDTAEVSTLSAFSQTLITNGNAAGWQSGLGLGDLATQNSVSNADWSGANLAVANGGTGGSTAADARTNLGIDAYTFYTGTSTTNTNFPVGSYLLANPGGTTPSLNSTVALTLMASNETFEIAGAGAAATGTWRSRGVIGGSLLCQRTA